MSVTANKASAATRGPSQPASSTTVTARNSAVNSMAPRRSKQAIGSQCGSLLDDLQFFLRAGTGKGTPGNERDRTMEIDLAGRSAIVTGGSKGIGFAVATQLA